MQVLNRASVKPPVVQNYDYAVEACNLCRAYSLAERPAVDDISLQIASGEIYALLGPNGAGKTTFINMLTTLLRPDSGTALVAGFDVVRQPAHVRHNIGVTFQETSLDKNLSGRDLLDIHGRLYRLEKHELRRRIAKLAALVELENALDRPVKFYSGGMKRRLELARSLLTEPQVLFLDEPTLGLDPHSRQHIWEYIRQLNRENGLTILFTTHYMDEAEELAHRVGIIAGGQLKIEGQPKTLINRLGRDIVALQGDAPPKFSERLESQSWVAYVRSGEGLLQIGLNEPASTRLSALLRIAEECNFQPDSVTTQGPSLSEVFFHYTGTRLKD
jgi:ABC-2 type transport system ATP-binding protein